MSFSKNRILFRADGNSEIGLGHLVRCFGLIDMLKDDFECQLIVRRSHDKIKLMIGTNYKVIYLKFTDFEYEKKTISKILKPKDIMVLDGYHFNSDYQQFIRSKIHKLVVVDDKADHHYYSDIIINHGDPTMVNRYKKEPYTVILAGFPYVIIRREFLESSKIKREVDKVDTVFVCMGGSDPFNITVKAVKACIICAFIKKIIIVTGSAYKCQSELTALINDNLSEKKILYESNVTSERMVELIKMSEIAICPASSISMEICCVKAGLLTGTVIDNQEAIHKQLNKSSCCISLGDFNSASINDIIYYLEKLRSVNIVNSIMVNQSSVIDGLSGKRLLEVFKNLRD